MPVMPGTERIKEAAGEYDFAVDAGAIGSIVLRQVTGSGNFIPSGSFIIGGFVEVLTPFTTGSAATLALNGNAAGDIVAAAVVSGAPWSTAGLKSVIPAFTGASAIKTTADRNIVATIAVGTITAGKLRAVVFYR